MEEAKSLIEDRESETPVYTAITIRLKIPKYDGNVSFKDITNIIDTLQQKGAIVLALNIHDSY